MACVGVRRSPLGVTLDLGHGRLATTRGRRGAPLGGGFTYPGLTNQTRPHTFGRWAVFNAEARAQTYFTFGAVASP